MSVDYIPDTESDFSTWENNFCSLVCAALATTLGLTTLETSAIATASGDYNDAVSDYQSKVAVVHGAQQTKAAKRKALEEVVRKTVRRIQTSPAMTDAIRAQLGITIADGTRTMTSASAVAAAVPITKIGTANRLQHVIDFRDADHQDKRAKPAGVKGAEIWMKIGAAPAAVVGSADPEDMRFLALDTATPYVMHFAEADAGKTVYYLLRWIANDGTKGPWGEMVQATIVG